MKPGPAALTGQ